MIYKRFTANLRAQNWFAIGIELGIVVLGVFIGTLVANWNEERIERRETEALLLQLAPEMEQQKQSVQSARRYFANTRNYAGTAFAGWRGDPGVSDADFVIAAYQASQAYGVSADGQAWTSIFGGDQLRRIDDPLIRAPLKRLMTADRALLAPQNVMTPYRDNVRLIIPNAVQQRIREVCGDKIDPSGLTLSLPATCRIAVPSARADAAALRAHPELIGQLAQHESAVAAQLSNLELFEAQVDALDRALERLE